MARPNSVFWSGEVSPKSESLSRKRLGKRKYLNDTKGLMRALDHYFENMVETPRIRVGKRQTFETLINEEALPLTGYLRNAKILGLLGIQFPLSVQEFQW